MPDRIQRNGHPPINSERKERGGEKRVEIKGKKRRGEEKSRKEEKQERCNACENVCKHDSALLSIFFLPFFGRHPTHHWSNKSKQFLYRISASVRIPIFVRSAKLETSCCVSDGSIANTKRRNRRQTLSSYACACKIIIFRRSSREESINVIIERIREIL